MRRRPRERRRNPKESNGGLAVSEAERLRNLEAVNAKLKRLWADAMLDVSTL